MAHGDQPIISVIVCTHNPRADYLERVLAALSQQTLDRALYEIIIVDNNSAPAIASARADRVIAEPRQGVSFARQTGVRAARAPLICFVDDDNVLDTHYLEAALAIAEREPQLGAFGGAAHADPETTPPRGFDYFLPFLGIREAGTGALNGPLTGPGDDWGPAEPIGAGMVLRRDIAEAYADYISATQAGEFLGRKGLGLLSGEDTLFVRMAARLGYQVGYRPALVMTHLIAGNRLTFAYLARLMEGHGQSRVILDAICGVATIAPAHPARTLALNAARRLKGHGWARAYVFYFYDRGLFRQARTIDAIDGLLTLDAFFDQYAPEKYKADR